MSVLETYLNTLTTLRGATVPETSYYAVLQTLLDEVGAGLRPRVQAGDSSERYRRRDS